MAPSAAPYCSCAAAPSVSSRRTALASSNQRRLGVVSPARLQQPSRVSGFKTFRRKDALAVRAQLARPVQLYSYGRSVTCRAAPGEGPAAGGAAGGAGSVAGAGTNNGAPEGKELREAADAVLRNLDEAYSEEKEHIIELLAELSRVREEEAVAEEERIRLEATAEELGSLALDAKADFVAASAQLEEMVQSAEEAIQRREAIGQEVAKVQEEIAQETESLRARIAVEAEVMARVREAEAGGKEADSATREALDGAKAKVADTRDIISGLDMQLALRQNDFLQAVRELETLQERVDELQNKAVSLESSLVNAEALASTAMEASAGGFAAEVEAMNQGKKIEAALQELVKDLRAMAEKAAKAQEVADKKKAKEEKNAEGGALDRSSMSMLSVEEQQGLESKDMMDDVARMEDLVMKSICEGDMPEKDEDVLVKATGKSSKFMAASMFSSGPGPGEPEKAFEQLRVWLYNSRFVILGGVIAVAAVAGLQNHRYFEEKFAAVLQTTFAQMHGMLSAWPETMHNLATSMAPEGVHIPRGVIDMLVLLLTSVIFVPLVCKLPGGSPVLGFLTGGAVIGPHALGVVQEVHAVQHLAEFGVVFLLFNIGLELSLDRLKSMRKYVFGLGLSQFLVTNVAIAGVCMALGLPGPASIIVGGAMALSSTAVALQVLQDRGESGSRHGRATFSVLLLQDLAVVALLMLIPLLAPSPDGGSVGLGEIGKALGMAGIKAVVCITVITAAGRAILRPLFRKIADFQNAEIFAATTLFTCIGTSLLTQVAGLSMALGAFLAGLMLAETEFALQVESDIAPYRGLLLGLFFMTVGMEISGALFIAKWKTILAGIALLLVGKTAVLVAVGPVFGLTRVASARTGFLLAPGGEFAFVAFGEAVGAGILAPALSNELFLVVALSMALTPYLAAFGQWLGKRFEVTDTAALLPAEAEVDDLEGHVIIAGFGRVGQVIAQVFSERLIPFVALDVRSDRVQAGRALDMPVFFGDAGSPAVLHSVRAEKAACVVVALDTPGANYRTVWAVSNNFPNVKIYVRAHDVDHGINLEKAGAYAVVPEILEPSLQLAAAVLGELKMPPDEVASTLDAFRRVHLSELRALSEENGSSLGYGYQSKEKKEEKKEEKDKGGDKESSSKAMPGAPAPA